METKVHPHVDDALNVAELDRSRTEYEDAWKAWSELEQARISGEDVGVSDIPYPTGPRKANLLHIHPEMDYKAYIWKAALRWHPGEPDRFPGILRGPNA